MKRILFCLLFFVLVSTEPAYSKVATVRVSNEKLMDFEDDGDGPPVVDPPPPASINGWVPILFIVGAAYIGFKIKRH